MLTVLMVMVLWSGPTNGDPYLYWVELQGIELHTAGDPSGSGEVSPLMAIAPGKMANMLKGSSEFRSVYGGRKYKISGERFYIPNHWIRNGHVDLVFFLRERDEPSADDVILPPRQVTVQLNDDLFNKHNGEMNAVLENAVYKFQEEYVDRQTIMVLQITRKKRSDCLFKGDDADAFFQMANDAILFQQELRHLGTRQLISGIEYNLLKFTSPQEAKPRDIEIIQEANLRACLRYRAWMDRFKGTHFFSELLPVYLKTMIQVRDTKISYSQKEEEKKYPSLPKEAWQQLEVKP